MKNKILSCFFIAISFFTLAQKPELVIPTYHTSTINVFKISQDGNYLITGGGDQVLKLWDYHKGREIKSFPTNQEIEDAVFSENGNYIFVATSRKIHVIEISSLRVINQFETPNYETGIEKIISSLDSRYIYYAYDDLNTKEKGVRKVSINGTNDTLIFKELPKNDWDTTIYLSISPDEKYVFLKSIKQNFFRNLQTNEKITIPEGSQFILPDGNLLVLDSNSDANIKAVTIQSNQTLWEHSFSEVVEDRKYWTYKNFFIDYKNMVVSFAKVNGENMVLIAVNLETGNAKEYTKILNGKKHNRLASVGNQFLVGSYDPNQLVSVNKSSLQVIHKFGKAIVSPYYIEGSSATPSLAVGGYFDNEINVVNYKNGKIKITTLPTEYGCGIIRMSEDGKVIAGVNENSKTHVSLFVDGKYKKISYENINEELLDIALSGDGSRLGIFFKKHIRIVNTQTGATIFSETVENEGTLSERIIFSENDKFLLSSKVGENNVLSCYSVKNKTKLWKKKFDFFKFYFKNNKTILAFNSYNDLLYAIDANNGSVINQNTKLPDLSYSGWDSSMNQDFTKIAVTNGNFIDIYNINNGTKQGSLEASLSGVRDLSFYKNEFLFSTGEDNTIKLWDTKTMKLLAQLIIFKGGDWALVTPDGHFDGSQQAIKDMYYVKGKDFIPLEQLYEKFYTPNLLAQLLSRDVIPEENDTDIEDLLPPPTVTIQYKKGTRNLTVEDDDIETINTQNKEAILTLQAEAPNSQISEIRLFHNGKLISNNTRNLIVEDDNLSSSASKKYTVNLLQGENVFKAITLNTQRTESYPTQLIINYKPKEEVVENQSHGIQLHLLVIGIDEYKNKKYNLNYAVEDAKGFMNSVEQGMEKITSNHNIYFIKNSEADRSKILSVFKEIASKAKPQDVFIFYYAGHGVMSQGKTPDFYLIPYNITQLYGNDGVLQSKGISATEIKNLAAQIPAQKQLYILDACQSAGALKSIALRGAAEEKAIAQLARSTGTHWLTASGSDQYATEFDELGHGVFTYALLEALSGKADSGDKKVTVNEIKAYIESRVPEISEKYKGSPQYPSSFGFGQDFPVSVFK